NQLETLNQIARQAVREILEFGVSALVGERHNGDRLLPGPGWLRNAGWLNNHGATAEEIPIAEITDAREQKDQGHKPKSRTGLMPLDFTNDVLDGCGRRDRCYFPGRNSPLTLSTHVADCFVLFQTLQICKQLLDRLVAVFLLFAQCPADEALCFYRHVS